MIKIFGPDEMSKEELARWLCLVEGVDFIYDKFEELGLSATLADTKKYIKKIDKALIKYINERFNAMLWDVNCGYKN